MLKQGDAGWSNPKVLAIFAVIFLCGAAFGCAATRSYLHSRLLRDHQYGGMQAAQHIGLSGLKTVLNLTDEQERTVTKELDDYAKYYQNIEDERDDVAAHGKKRILAVLNPEQRKKFNAIYGQGQP